MAVRDGLRQASAASDAMRHFNGCAVSPPRDHIVTRYIEERAISLHSARTPAGYTEPSIKWLC